MSDPRWAEALARLPDYFGNHVRVSTTALALALIVSLPLAFVCVRRPRLRAAALAATSIVQTIPGLALLALFYPLLLGAAELSRQTLGYSFSALGFLPAVLALALYGILPVLRNTITGLTTIDPAIKEAALGVGMTRLQSLFMVEWPLALPVIMAGVRTSAVWIIGTATLSTPIGQTSLGNYIFTGLQTQNWVFVLTGCAAAAVLALAVDLMLALMESGTAARRRARVAAGFVGLAAVASLAWLPGAVTGPKTYIVGAKTFTEQYILAALIEQRLVANGLSAVHRDGLGSAVIFKALAAGDIDIYVDYSGTIWANEMGRGDIKPRAELLDEVAQWLQTQHNVTLLGSLGFENAYALAMLDRRADALAVHTLSDLSRHAPQLTIAGDYEFFGRPEWRSIESTYHLAFRQQRQMQAEFMYQAAAAGEVDLISAYTSDGRVAQFGLRTLVDDKGAIPPYDAIVLISPKRAEDAALIEAVRPLINAIPVATMREANRRAGGAGAETPDAIARWLGEQIAKRQ